MPIAEITSQHVEAFLQRIGLSNIPECSLTGLEKLQRAFMQSIPFENLDVFLRRPLDLSFGALHDKIILHNRGGYCFELNSYYHYMLRFFGFEVQRALARVWLRNPQQAPTRNHLTLRVTLDGVEYISDVGFGGLNARMPIQLARVDGTPDGEGLVRIRPDEKFGYMLERQVDQTWMPQYSFEHSVVTDQDVEAANFWMEHHPKSHFRENVFAARFTHKGRIGVFDQQVTERVGAKTIRSEKLATIAKWRTFVAHELGLTLPELSTDQAQRLAAKIQQ